MISRWHGGAPIITQFGYDLLGRLTNRATVDIYGYVSNTVAFAYTARGLTNHTDELAHVTRLVYDAAGRMLSQTNANGEVLQFTYNPAENLAEAVELYLETWGSGKSFRPAREVYLTSMEVAA